MKNERKPAYVPTVRLKKGEYQGLQRLAPDVAQKIQPRLVIPPPDEKDPAERRRLTQEEIVYQTGRRIGQHWPLRPAFLEPRFLFTAFGEAESVTWLPRIFKLAREAGASVTPVATLSDMLGVRGRAFQQALADEMPSRLAIRVESGELDKELDERVATAMSAFGLTPEACTLMLDFSDADMTDSEAVASVIVGALESVQEIGLWHEVVFQGTNYPERNPAEDNSSTMVPRNEWLAWRSAVQGDANAFEHLTFGDYCADHGRFKFKSGGGAPAIRHYRYCTPQAWYVTRGKAEGPTDQAMQAVSQSILKSGHFAGRDFSSADEYIYASANGYDGPGNATTWREINICHHITQVVSDLGEIWGFQISRRDITDVPKQLSLIDEKL